MNRKGEREGKGKDAKREAQSDDRSPLLQGRSGLCGGALLDAIRLTSTQCRLKTYPKHPANASASADFSIGA